MSELIYVEKVDLIPGYRTKHIITVNPDSEQYQALLDKIKEEIVGMEQLQGLEEYFVRIKPIEVEVLVK